MSGVICKLNSRFGYALTHCHRLETRLCSLVEIDLVGKGPNQQNSQINSINSILFKRIRWQIMGGGRETFARNHWEIHQMYWLVMKQLFKLSLIYSFIQFIWPPISLSNSPRKKAAVDFL